MARGHEQIVIEIAETTSLTDAEVEDLARILVGVIEGGASVGWVAPPPVEVARDYWRGVITPGIILLLARDGDQVVGTAQLELAQRENGRHRAEVGKVLVDPARKGQGIGRMLLDAIEAVAGREGRTLLHLDTTEGDPANAFYQRCGWTAIGTIPNWARFGPDGQLFGTTFYYKVLR